MGHAVTIQISQSAAVNLLTPMLVITGLGLNGMARINASLKTVYEDRTVCLVQLDKILNALHMQRYDLNDAMDEIGQQINTVQTQTQNVVQAIALIVKRIEEISRISSAKSLSSEAEHLKKIVNAFLHDVKTA